jgi:CMP-N,N'-diacetyllegionaminic acid synthase
MLAIIPARGGSKGLPGKNILQLQGKPLIGYSIEAALKSESVNRVIVSTDDTKIAETASRFGAEIPFLRPDELAQDDSSAIDVYIYTIDRLREQSGIAIDEFMVLQPTSPLRTHQDIDQAVEIFRNKQADSVISVTESAHPPVWAKKISPEGILTEYFPEYASNKNRQEIETAYMPNGAIFIFRYDLLKKFRHYYSDKTYPYIMPAQRSVDIDTQLDFDFAEFLLQQENK